MAPRFGINYEPDVQGFIASLAPVPRRQVERDLEKLALRGLKALPPLTGNIQGPVWELRSKVEGHGLYRIFYYRDGAESFHAFFPYQKKDEKLPNRIRDEVLKRYEQLTGKKP
jgi:phage-related protein